MKTYFSLGVLFVVIFFINCEKKDDNIQNCAGVSCTEIFLFLTVKVIDSNGQPVVLENYKVILEVDSTDITPNESDNAIMNNKGEYIIFSDNYSQEYQNKTTNIHFSGFIDSVEVVASNITVGADCCHVKMISDHNIIRID